MTKHLREHRRICAGVLLAGLLLACGCTTWTYYDPEPFAKESRYYGRMTKAKAVEIITKAMKRPGYANVKVTREEITFRELHIEDDRPKRIESWEHAYGARWENVNSVKTYRIENDGFPGRTTHRVVLRGASMYGGAFVATMGVPKDYTVADVIVAAYTLMGKTAPPGARRR